MALNPFPLLIPGYHHHQHEARIGEALSKHQYSSTRRLVSWVVTILYPSCALLVVSVRMGVVVNRRMKGKVVTLKVQDR